MASSPPAGRPRRVRFLALRLLALSLAVTYTIVSSALAMTAWDLSLDPRMVADGNWIWQDGGIYFGIPLSNFAGWVVTSALIYAVWSRIDNFAFGILNSELSIQNSKFKIQNFALPVWAYIITWVGESMANALFWGGPAVALCVFVGMGLFAAPALRLLLRQRQMCDALQKVRRTWQ